jgi:hypothetical protein
MLKIQRHGTGFKVSISEPGTGMRGYSVQARKLEQVHETIDHYYGDPHALGTCPLCELQRKEQAREKSARRKSPTLTRCIHCDAYINPQYGKYSPAEHSGHSGTEEDPRAPGDYDNICDSCNYGKGLRGGPNA